MSILEPGIASKISEAVSGEKEIEFLEELSQKYFMEPHKESVYDYCFDKYHEYLQVGDYPITFAKFFALKDTMDHYEKKYKKLDYFDFMGFDL